MIGTLVLVLAFTLPAVAAKRPPRNGAVFVDQSAPAASLIAGQAVEVRVTVRNSGTTTWTKTAGYKLGAQSPADNPAFRIGRVPLPVASVKPGRSVTFSFKAAAPAKAGAHVFQWRMVQEKREWFGQLTPKVQVSVTPKRRRGKVRLVGWHAVDDDGPFNAVGFTYMSALRLYHNGEAQQDKDLDEAAAAGYHFARILSEVGWDDGRRIDPRWPDYDETLTGYIKKAWSKGIRTQICIFGGSEWAGSQANRAAHVDRVIRLITPLQEAVMSVQIGNEPGRSRDQFEDAVEAGQYARKAAAAMPDVIVSLGAPPDGKEAEYKAQGFPLSPHLDRGTMGTVWRTVRQPWDVSEYAGKWFNDEPLGPGSSVNTDSNCERQKALHMMTFIGKGFATVFHSSGGVGYKTNEAVSAMPCFKDIPKAVALLPQTLPEYARKNGHWRDAPFKNLDAFIDGDSGRGSMRNYSGISGDDFATMILNVPVGIKLQCNTITGPVVVYRIDTLASNETINCAPGVTFEFGPGARLLRRPMAGVASPN